MRIIAEFTTPEGTIVVTRLPPDAANPWVTWVVDIPGLGRHHYSRKRDAMHHARTAIRLLTPPRQFDLVKALDMVREYA